MHRVLVLVEGQTEERFVKDVLTPVYEEQQIYITPTVLVTKRVKDGPSFKGGVTQFNKFESDVRRLLQGAGGALVTTLLDYYGLPEDFPGMATRPMGSGLARAAHVEMALWKHFGSLKNFLPFLVLHEFEALLFSNEECLPAVMNAPEKKGEFSAIRSAFVSPEEINERPDWAPSKRIKKLFPHYRKTLHGPIAAKRMGLEVMRSNCPHFSEWLTCVEQFNSA